MYHAVLFPKNQHDFHQFVWTEDPQQPFVDYLMTQLTFGVSASPFTDNVVMKQNILNHGKEFPQAAKAVLESFYVNDGPIGANSIEEAKDLQLQGLFASTGFLLQKWKSSEPFIMEHIPTRLFNEQPTMYTENYLH